MVMVTNVQLHREQLRRSIGSQNCRSGLCVSFFELDEGAATIEVQGLSGRGGGFRFIGD
jgi:hypothetical protein